MFSHMCLLQDKATHGPCSPSSGSCMNTNAGCSSKPIDGISDAPVANTRRSESETSFSAMFASPSAKGK